jgi:hypothetical protein
LPNNTPFSAYKTLLQKIETEASTLIDSVKADSRSRLTRSSPLSARSRLPSTPTFRSRPRRPWPRTRRR